MTDPKITIGLATYNGGRTLSRAIESVLQQDDDFELLIADNASTDSTQEICEKFARTDGRIVYIRQPVNRGPLANLLTVRDRARGKYFMWLGDDDWLGPGYLRACADVLDRSRDHVLVGGLARYFEAGKDFYHEEDVLMVLEQVSPIERVLTYFSLVGRNGIFYGLYRLEVVRGLRFGGHFGSDWSFIAALAFIGKVTTLQTVHVNRQVGVNSSPEGLKAVHGVRGYSARPENHAARLAGEMYLDISKRVDVYDSLPVLERQRLALSAANAIIVSRYGSLSALLRSRLILRTRARRLVRQLGLVRG